MGYSMPDGRSSTLARLRPLLAILLFVVMAALSFGCSREMRKDLRELSRVATAAKTFFTADDVGLNLVNNRVLVLSLVNCPAGRLPDTERQYAAHEAALWTKKNYNDASKLESISVVFVERRSFLIFNASSSHSYNFPLRELGVVPVPPAPGTRT